MFAPTGQLGQVHTVKKIFLIFLYAGSWSFLLMNLWFSSKLVSKMNFKKMAPAWRNFKNIFFTICTWPNRPVGAKNFSGFQFEGKTDVWISQVRRVKFIKKGKQSNNVRLTARNNDIAIDESFLRDWKIIRKIFQKMSSNIARRDILRAGIINHSLALLRALLECGY